MTVDSTATAPEAAPVVPRLKTVRVRVAKRSGKDI